MGLEVWALSFYITRLEIRGAKGQAQDDRCKGLKTNRSAYWKDGFGLMSEGLPREPRCFGMGFGPKARLPPGLRSCVFQRGLHLRLFLLCLQPS